MDKYFVELGKAIQQVRIDKRITQQELADKIGKTRNCVGNWESGRRKIDIIDYQKVCKALKINADNLLKQVEKYVD